MAQEHSVFFVDENTKTLMRDMSSLFGVKYEIIKELLEYMCFVWILKMSENPNDEHILTIPYIGKVCLKFMKDYIDADGNMKTDVKSSFELNDTFKTLVSDIHDESIQPLAEHLKKNYIDKLSADILS